MSRYLEVARDIYDWLESFQVKETTLDVEIVEGSYRANLSHPAGGQRPVELSASQHGVSVSNGVALRLSGSDQLEVYDSGAIFDPLDGRVQGEHYSTSHFALLAAILFVETRDESQLESAKLAIDFHLRTSGTEYQPMSEWMYHWDFQNYAFVLTYRLLHDYLTEEERLKWQAGLKSWRTNRRNKLTNWAAMRAWAYAERHQLFRNPLDGLAVSWNLRYVKKARSSDGCFDDNAGLSRPIQYHIFTVAILHRLWLMTGRARTKTWFDKGLEYFLPFIDPDGDFNYVGRGHEQIFGYAAAIYALEAGYKENGHAELQNGANKLFDYLLQFKKGDYFPLVLNEIPDEERPGWYDYHHLTVYNAFAGAWLGLTHLLKNPQKKARRPAKDYFWFSQPTRTAIVARPAYYTVFYGGLSEYLSEAAVTPHHLWWEGLGCVFSCPGGPTFERFGKQSPPDQEKNLFAPIAKNHTSWYLPASKPAEHFQQDSDSIRMMFDYGPFLVKRSVRFEKSAIEFEDEFVFLKDQEFDDFRFFNLPVMLEKFTVDLSDNKVLNLKANAQILKIEFTGEADTPFECLETTTSAKGRVQVISKRDLNFKATKGDTRIIKFRISKVEQTQKP